MSADLDSTVHVTLASQDDLEGIKSLQNKNLRKLISPDEAKSEGFVTAEYSVDFLKEMHGVFPSVVAKETETNKIVGYALVATRASSMKHELLRDLVGKIDSLSNERGEPLKDMNYVLVGQLCVAKEYRGKGLVNGMYAHFRNVLQGQGFHCCITDVARDNPRSIRAHHKVGFRSVHTISHDGVQFDVIVWDWRE